MRISKPLKILADENIICLDYFFKDQMWVDSITKTSADNIINLAREKSFNIILTRSKTLINKNLFNSSLYFIGSLVSGTDHICFEDFKDKNTPELYCAKGCNSDAVLSYIQSVFKIILNQNQKLNLKNKSLNIGIIGYGFIGKKVAKWFKSLGHNVFISDPYLNLNADLKNLNLDLISIHCSLNCSLNCSLKKSNTEFPSVKLIDLNYLNQLKPGAIIINASRGEVIDEAGLIKSQHVDFYLDVFNGEPVLSKQLNQLKNIKLITPHIAGYTPYGLANGTLMAYQRICEFFKFKENKILPEKFKHNAHQDLVQLSQNFRKDYCQYDLFRKNYV